MRCTAHFLGREQKLFSFFLQLLYLFSARAPLRQKIPLLPGKLSRLLARRLGGLKATTDTTGMEHELIRS